MSTFFQKLFGKSRTNNQSPSQKCNVPQFRKLRIESLECRELLAVSPVDFETIKANYGDLDLKNFGDYTIYEVGATTPAGTDQRTFAFNATGLQSAINAATSTTKDTLIVVRTGSTPTTNTITLNGVELAINTSPQYGSVTIVSFGASDLSNCQIIKYPITFLGKKYSSIRALRHVF